MSLGPRSVRTGLLLVTASTHVFAATSHVAQWQSPRAAVIGNNVVIEGGRMIQGNFADGKWQGSPTQWPTPDGLLFVTDLCDSFNTTGDIDKFLNQTAENVGPDRPVWIGGGIFANEFEFYTFGGVPYPERREGDSSIIHGNIAKPNAEYATWEWGAGPWSPTIGSNALGNVSDNVAFGSFASAPSESLAWYFSGLRAADNGAISLFPNDNDTDAANTTSKTIIEINTANSGAASFRELPWPEDLLPRAEGALVWLPYGAHGILIAFGGTSMPGDLSYMDAVEENNIAMTDVAIYDIENENWAFHTLSSGPPPTASFCTAVATATDSNGQNGHFIYVYGGYDGSYLSSANKGSYDTVWVLSVPSFEWTLLDEGTEDHRRQSHICLTPTTTQMLSIGGMTEYGNNLVSPGYLDVFDLSAGKWTHTYDASSAAKYEVPATLISQIGAGFGSVSSSLDSSAQSMLSSSYSGLIPSYKPPTCAALAPSPRPASPKSKPAWETPLIASVAALVGLAMVATLVWCIWIRKPKQSVDGSASKRKNILQWRAKTDRPPKSEGGSDGTAVEPIDYFAAKNSQAEAYELCSTVTSPNYGIYGHGSPQLVSPSSPLGSVEADGRSPHEMLATSQRESMSIRNFPGYPRSIQGSHIISARSDSMSVSHPSENPMPRRHLGGVSPYELAQDRSNEDLPRPPNDQVLAEVYTSPIQREQRIPQSPFAMSATGGLSRKPVNRGPVSPEHSPLVEDRPGHQRNHSSMSSNIPNLPSPAPEEDKRMSRQIDALPEFKLPERRSTAPNRSAYHENLEVHRPYGTR